MKNVCDGFFNALSSKTRLRILYILRQGPRSVTQIVEESGFEQSLVSHNLHILKHCHFVNVEVRGKQRIYSINNDSIGPLFELVDRHIENYCHPKEAVMHRLP